MADVEQNGRSGVNWWIRIHRWFWLKRLTLKGAILALTVFAVCFPRPVLLMRHIQRWSDPNALIEPNSPHIESLVEELLASQPVGTNGIEDAKRTLLAVQELVYKKLPYAFDWVTWGMADYLPTVEEAMEMGREDCDGRAVVGASILSRLGFEPRLVSDGAHVWVWTPQGETMSPGRVGTLEATPTGFKINWGGLWTLPRIAAVNASLFPLVRELIILAVLWGLMLQPVMSKRRMFTVGLLLLGALFLLRYGGAHHRGGGMWAVWFGIATLSLVVYLGVVSSWRQIKESAG
ncbi:MAG: transglutaminase domain-containing protein [Planctomycetes bacterium]|nr:transglutaminase domain-containing protein [Planctomycetota bacterium]